MIAITRADVMRMANDCSLLIAVSRDGLRVAGSTDDLYRFAAMVSGAESIKHQAEIQRLTTLANTAEKWRGIALARDGDGRTVQKVQDEARAEEREECAGICDRFAARDMHPAECAAAIRARGQKGGA